MAIYLGKNVVLAFCVDYSASIDGRLVVYEAQHLLSDNYDTPNTRMNNLGVRSGTQLVEKAKCDWEPYFLKISSGQFIVDFPPSLEADKAVQRKHLFANGQSFTPDFLICDTETPIEKIADFVAKHNRRVVIKGKDGLGNGNKFLSEHPEESLTDFVAFYKRRYSSFVVEQEVIYPPSEIESGQSQSYGVYYRDVVFYNTETNQLRFFEVYNVVLARKQSANSHNDFNVVSETCFFLTHNPSQLKSLMKVNEQKFPALYSVKKSAFTALSNQILHYLQTESVPKNFLSDPLLTLFINKFHTDDKVAYQAYLKLGRFIDTKHQSEQAVADKLDRNLKHLFLMLASLFSDEENSISERKQAALKLVALKITALSTQDLWIFQHLLLNLRDAPGPSSLREIWHRKNFFRCCCTADPYANTNYGNTTTGYRLLQMIDDAQLKAKNIPQFIYAPPSTEQLLQFTRFK